MNKHTQQEKVDRILQAAEGIFAKKGFRDASISEIAKKANVYDSVIYKYFKGKEDLLFSIPLQRMTQFLSELHNHLQGILDPESQLGKLIWFHLHFLDKNKSTSRILVMECRSTKVFYTTEIYNLMRQYAKILLSILLDGVNKGVFRHDINMRVVRDIIFGVLESTVISCIAMDEIDKAENDFESIMNIIISMIKDNKHENNVEDKGLRILIAAEKIFAEYGYDKAKISDIAKLSQVAEGTVYEYFENKEDLLLAIPIRRFRKHMDEMKETFEIKSSLRKLRRLIRYHFNIFLIERDFLKVFLTEICTKSKFYQSSAFEEYRRYYSIVEIIIEQGKKDGTFSENINPRVFRNLYLGAFSQLALRWYILNKQSDILQEINHTTDLLTDSVITDKFRDERYRNEMQVMAG